MQKPSVLIVAYAFPPNSVVGAQRPLRMVKYLPRLTDWQPIVLSARQTGQLTDHSLLDEIPAGVPVYRTRSWEPIRLLQRRLRAGARQTGEEPGNAKLGVEPGVAPAKRPPSRFKKLLLDLLSTPDSQLGWVGFAVAAGLRIARRHRPDVILVTVPPWSALIVGHVLGALTRIPWVADYRDPWTDIDRGPVAPWRQRFERWLENRLLKNAAAILSSSDRYTAIMRDRFTARPSGDFATMFNGFDEAKFDGQPPQRNEIFTITHLGSLYSYVQPESVFVGLRNWLAQEPARRRQVRLQFIGQIDGAVRASLARLGLLDLTELSGFVPHAEAIARCRGSQILLLAMGNTSLTPAGWMPSKLYEYLACRTPILAYTVRGEAAQAIENAGAGAVVSSDDPRDVVAALDRLAFQCPPPPSAAADDWPAPLRRFTQAAIIPALATVLAQVRRPSRR